MRVLVPPIKCQGIKTKLVPDILRVTSGKWDGVWIEPFLGSAVVVLNAKPSQAILADANPHVITFYKAIRSGDIDGKLVRAFLETEGEKLARLGGEYYYEVRNRFNDGHEALDFLFLNRACFNGVIRFNRSGKFNVPFGHKPKRFARAYVTKIVNQVESFRRVAQASDWEFGCWEFTETIERAGEGDLVYCDPPYIGRHVDYFSSWNVEREETLYSKLKSTKAGFLLSTWHSNQHRRNAMIDELWGEFQVSLKEHFYHVGARETNRKPMLEALVTNFVPGGLATRERFEQGALFDKAS